MANFSISTKKILSEENIRKIIMLGISLKDIATNIQDKCLEEYNPNKTYMKDSYVTYDGYLWKAKTVSTGEFNSDKWLKQNDELSLITKSDIESMVNLSSEELVTLQNILLDSSIELSHTWSSSKVYSEILNAINTSKHYTLETFAKASKASYHVVNSTSEMTDTSVIYLLSNGTNFDLYITEDGTNATKIGDTTIDLSQYAKLTDLDDYLKKTDADGKYATITTVDGKVDKTSILSAISSTPSDDKLLSEKAIKSELDNKANDSEVVKKSNITTTIINTSTEEQIPSARSVYTNLNTIKLNGFNGIYGKVTATTDMNDLYASGQYEVVWDTTDIANFPPVVLGNTRFRIKIEQLGRGIDMYRQEIEFQAGVVDRGTWIRSYIDGTWQEWRKVVMTTVEDSIGSVTQQSNSNYTCSNGNWEIKDGICYIPQIQVTCNTPAGVSIAIGTGLPKPDISQASRIYTTLVCWGDTTGTVALIGCGVSKTGQLVVAGGTAGKSYVGGISYKVADN